MTNFKILVHSLLLFLFCVAEEIDVDVGGESRGIDIPIAAILHNNYDFEIAVYYEVTSPQHDLRHLINIKPLGSANVNTYHSHVFHATKLGADKSSVLSSVSVTLGIEDYFFLGSPDTAPLSSKSDGMYQTNAEIRDRLHPAVKIMTGTPTTAMNARFRSLSSRPLDLFYDDKMGGSPQGTLRPGSDSTTNAYEGHVFFYTPHGQKNNVLGRHVMTKNQVLYLLTDEEFPGTTELFNYTDVELSFMADYLQSSGIHWRCFYGKDGPRPPPKLHMWPADRIGQVHSVNSTHGFWYSPLTPLDLGWFTTCRGPSHQCQSDVGVNMEIEVISRKPRAFVIPNFLSDAEADEIIAISGPRIKESTVGNNDAGGVRKCSTRTSSNTWIARGTSQITETIYLRAADLLNISEKLLNTNTNAEEMQVVHYEVGQKYDAHHDWGVNGYAETRFITLLLYLNDQKHPNAGGETSFPKAAGGRGIKVHPGKGSAVLFYNLLEDGNCDDLALHEATPVRDGEKWLANFWVWDPKRK